MKADYKYPKTYHAMRFKNGGEICCPVCGDGSVHVTKVSNLEEGLGSGWNKTFSFDLECESGCTATILLNGHKGQLCVEVCDMTQLRTMTQRVEVV